MQWLDWYNAGPLHQFYANILALVNINLFLYINDQFALVNIKSIPDSRVLGLKSNLSYGLKYNTSTSGKGK